MREKEAGRAGADGELGLEGPGTRLLVIYKASCPTCLFFLPLLDEAYRLSAGRLKLCLVSQDDAETTAAVTDRLELSVPVSLDQPDYGISGRAGIAAVPAMVLVEDGRFTETVEGFDRAAARRLIAASGAGLGAEAVAVFDREGLPEFRPG